MSMCVGVQRGQDREVRLTLSRVIVWGWRGAWDGGGGRERERNTEREREREREISLQQMNDLWKVSSK